MLQITHLKVWGYIWLEIVHNEDFLGPTPPPPPYSRNPFVRKV